MRDYGRSVLLAALALLLLAVWLDPPGSWLAEPDEPRYAEIPREMLATGDWVVPRLNGVPYFEKPPLLYWANAAAMKVLGNTNFAARLATRLAGLGTLLLVWLGVGRLWGRRAGLIAAVFFLIGPLPFTFSRLNLTDGVLTFFFTATVFAGFATIRAKNMRRPWLALSAWTGAAAAGAFLSKGLVGVVLPGGILFFWALATRQGRALTALLLGPALPVFLALSLPWLWLAEQRVPGFLHFFFIHEHFQRFATPIANRPGPIYYFVVVFVAGFLPALPFFFRGLKGSGPRDPEALFFVIWFFLVLVFFSLSHSKLSPYLFPAFPAAAALAARGLLAGRGRGFGIAAAVSIAMAPLALAIPAAREAAVRSGVLPVVLAGAVALIAGAAAAWALRRREDAALGSLAAGWAVLYLSLTLLWPHTALARDIRTLALDAKSAAARAPGAPIVTYRTYLQGFPWFLESVIPLADHTSELEYWWLPPARRAEIFWSKEDFWRRWSSGQPLVVLRRKADGKDFATASPTAVTVSSHGKHEVVTNFTR
jgi:4-amino-4-deoxy-L-arabinose transferase-like glycosyltransferase